MTDKLVKVLSHLRLLAMFAKNLCIETFYIFLPATSQCCSSSRYHVAFPLVGPEAPFPFAAGSSLTPVPLPAEHTPPPSAENINTQ